MKYILTLVSVFLFYTGYSQKVSFFSKKNINDTAELYLLYSDGHYKTFATTISTNEIDLDLSYPIFATLKYNGQEKVILLSPGRSLSIKYDSSNKLPFFISGTGKNENILLEKINFGKQPNYTKQESSRLLSSDSLKSYLMPVVNNKLKADSILIYNSSVPLLLKNLIYDEYKAAELCFLYHLAQNEMRWSKNPFQEENLDYIMSYQFTVQANISPSRIKNGFYYNLLLENQQQYTLQQILKGFKKNNNLGRKQIESYLGVSFDSISKKVEYFGERNIITWLASKNNFPAEVAEKMLFNKIVESYENGKINVAKSLTDTFYRYYPKSGYKKTLTNNTDLIVSSFKRNKENKNIRIYSNKVEFLDHLIKPYLGKLIYLDIWGSWCGPCRVEMRYAKELKERFKNKDIVFLYLAFDEDKNEKDWREAIYFYNLEGEHYRVTEQIKNYWKRIKELGGESDSYPTYLIIDSTGKVVNVNAKRPSDMEELYNELNRYLK